MYLHKEKTGWKTLRFDSRTYTAQRAREQEGELVRKIPQEYIFLLMINALWEMEK